MAIGYEQKAFCYTRLLRLVMLFNYFIVRILSAIPNCMNNDFVISNLKVDNEILNN